MQITVYGLPAPQGSKRFVGHAKNGRGLMIESSRAVKPWREAVKFAALAACADANPTQAGHGLGCVSGPVAVEMVFTLPKPKSAPKGRRTYPDKKPDIDKLCRSTIDALVDAGVMEDDARIVNLSATKVFPGEGPGSLCIPGAQIRIGGIALNG